jgi:hypothetical protein
MGGDALQKVLSAYDTKKATPTFKKADALFGIYNYFSVFRDLAR